VKPSNEIRQFIMNKEGCKFEAYKPVPTDRPTIGYGSTFYSNGDPVCMGDTITKQDAINLFNEELDKFATKLSMITNPKCTQNQFDAVLSLCYNVGIGAFKTSTSGSLYQNGQDISNRFALWNKSGGVVLKGLTTRRLQERAIYVTGRYPPN
jgi:lysozyme